MTKAPVAAIACLILLPVPAWPQGTAPLTVCLQWNDPPLSIRGRDAPSDFDFVLSQSIASTCIAR